MKATISTMTTTAISFLLFFRIHFMKLIRISLPIFGYRL